MRYRFVYIIFIMNSCVLVNPTTVSDVAVLVENFQFLIFLVNNIIFMDFKL